MKRGGKGVTKTVLLNSILQTIVQSKVIQSSNETEETSSDTQNNTFDGKFIILLFYRCIKHKSIYFYFFFLPSLLIWSLGSTPDNTKPPQKKQKLCHKNNAWKKMFNAETLLKIAEIHFAAPMIGNMGLLLKKQIKKLN